MANSSLSFARGHSLHDTEHCPLSTLEESEVSLGAPDFARQGLEAAYRCQQARAQNHCIAGPVHDIRSAGVDREPGDKPPLIGPLVQGSLRDVNIGPMLEK